ncbi:cache domain-containing protein [Enterovibrio nigricans]|uniref:Two-component system, NarL family, sensor kinase n=1 Tax=Enterovibrio nigricans DSM 22720 TaxID=1121868 RepID=A0A1T4VCZ5_9GAMM|nr:cache domain-containing protein [Enterovibrio nigricans]SKA62822.1 two-component system, NarL family, sensor kinase [Enterovibrio nigricans DSM 22720]
MTTFSGINTPLRVKILILTMVPLLLMFGLIIGLVMIQSDSLSNNQANVIRSETLASKKQELLKYVELARASISPIYDAAHENDAEAQKAVIDILNKLTYGEDGYFFAYTYDGTNLVLPYQPEMVGTNIWEVEDSRGFKLLQALIRTAQQGGGYVDYYWHKPSKKEQVKKLSYAIGLEKWGWMVGTGVYIDDIDTQVTSVHRKIAETISKTFIGLSIALVITIGIMASLATSIHINARELANKKLQTLNRQLIESQEEERTRIARELHDGINQMLVSVKYRLDNIQEAKTQEELNQNIALGQDTLDMAVTELRRISKDLKPALLDDLGLLVALEDLAKEVSLRSGMQVLFDHHIDMKHVSKSAEVTLYRVAQEALHNAEKHAKAEAEAVDMILQEEEGEIVLTIADDGVGFEEHRLTATTHSMGLKNMRERIENLDGVFSISSLLNQGTEVRAILPFIH